MASNGRSVKYNPLNPIGNASRSLVSPRLVKARGESKWVQAYEDDGNQAKSAAKSRKRPSRQKKAKEQSTFQPNGDSDAEIVTHLDMFEPDFDSDAQLSSALSHNFDSADSVSSHEGETFPFQDHQNFVEVVPPAPKRLETALDEADLIVENMLSQFSQPGTALDAIVAQSEDGREPPQSVPATKPPTISLEPPGDYKISAVQSEQKSRPLVESTLEMGNPDNQTGLNEVAFIAASERPGEIDRPAEEASAVQPVEQGQAEIENVQAASQQEAHTAIDSTLLSELAALKKRVEMLESLSSPRDPPRQSHEFDEAQRGCWGSCLTACSSVNSPTCLPCPSLCKDDSEDLLSAQDEEEASPPTPTPEPTPAPSHHSDEIEIAQAEGAPADEAPTWVGDIPPPPIEITPYTKLVYRDVFDGLYQEAVNTDTDKCKCGINCICPAQLCKCCPEGCFDKASQLSFDCTSLIKSKKTKKKVATPALNKARGVGWRIVAKVAFPLVPEVFRDIWVVGEWLLVFLGFILSIVSFTAEENPEAFNRTHLTLITLAFALSTLDVFTTLWECKSCKEGLKAYAKGRRENCCTRLQQQVEEGASDSMEVPLGLRPCWKITKNVADVARILAAELLFYPLLICDLIEFITSLPINGMTSGFLGYLEDNAVDLILFLIGIASLVFYVYFMRLYVLGAGIAHLNTVRKPKVVNISSEPPDETTSGKPKYNPSIKDTAYYYMSYFFFHVLIQMIAQICMIVTICFQIRQELDGSTLNPSGALWFLMIAGYVLPLLGIFSFFIPTYFWASLEFPNTIYLDTLKILTQPGVDHAICADRSMKEVKEELEKLLIREDQAKKVNEELQKMSFFSKATYPFTRLHLVLLSMLYTGFQLAFIVTAARSINNFGALDASLVFINLFANHYVFAVAGFWVMVFFIALCR